MSKSIFEKIAKGEMLSYKVWESEEFMAFLSIGPLCKGHTLVVPKENWGDYVFDLNDEQYQKLMAATKEVAGLLKEKMNCDRCLVWVQGYEVPHVHVHLLPSVKGDGLMSAEIISLSESDFQDIQKQIVGH